TGDAVAQRRSERERICGGLLLGDSTGGSDRHRKPLARAQSTPTGSVDFASGRFPLAVVDQGDESQFQSDEQRHVAVGPPRAANRLSRCLVIGEYRGTKQPAPCRSGQITIAGRCIFALAHFSEDLRPEFPVNGASEKLRLELPPCTGCILKLSDLASVFDSGAIRVGIV